ncbi:MAG: ABC transporter permease [Geminicoccaceae bacterium]|nr:ABC transporter permease [Geminicoccaceae bacterium]
MNLLRLALAYLVDRLGTTILTILLLALGVATVTVILLVGHQLRDRIGREIAGVDLVVGAKGSPLQLILSAVFQIDVPTGNVPLAEADIVRRHPLVASAIPIAMGDTAGGFRIVGTEPTLLEMRGAALARGRIWQAPMEAVLGAAVARASGLDLGATFVGAHGLGGTGFAHAEHPYTIVGILAPTGTVLDRLILTAVESVWQVHAPARPQPTGPPAAEEHGAEAHGDGAHRHGEQEGHVARRAPPEKAEITALLVRYRSPLAAVQLPRLVNAQPSLQAASPAFEAARLLAIVGFGLDAFRLVGIVLVTAAALSVFVALSNALEERRGDLALMRVLGATRGLVFRSLLLEALLLTGSGLVLGLVLGHSTVEVLAALFRQASEAGMTGWVLAPEELWLLPGVLGLGLLAASIPVIRAYRTDLASTLARA